MNNRARCPPISMSSMQLPEDPLIAHASSPVASYVRVFGQGSPANRSDVMHTRRTTSALFESLNSCA